MIVYIENLKTKTVTNQPPPQNLLVVMSSSKFQNIKGTLQSLLYTYNEHAETEIKMKCY